MSRKRELQRQLGRGYAYRRRLSDRDIQRLRKNPPRDFSERTAAALTAGCLRLTAVLYRAGGRLLLGYDVLVKDDPRSAEWIFYDSLPEPVSLKEAAMLSVLDRFAGERGLSYTDSCFDRLDGKSVTAKGKPSLTPVTLRVPDSPKGWRPDP